MNLRSYTLHDLVRRNAQLHGRRTAFVFEGRHVSHAEYAERAGRLAAGLAGIGVAPGDRVAILAANGLEYVDLLAAAARLAAVVVPINSRLSADEVAHVLNETAPRAVFVAGEFEALLSQAALPKTPCYVIGAARSGQQPVSGLYVDEPAPVAEVDDDTALLIIHTAAVEGRSRGAVLTHGGLIAASMQLQLAWRLSADDVNLGVLPLFHVAGIGFMLAAQQAGAATLLLPGFDPAALVRHIDDDGGSMIGVFPPMLGALTDAAESAHSSLQSLRVVIGIDSTETIARFQARCPGAAFWSSYGQTETSGPVSLSPMAERPGSAGRPAGLCTVAILDEQGRPLPHGAVGEIVVRGPTVFHGYWGHAEDSAIALRNGWHHTGDLGHLDSDGYLWYGGRSEAKRLIKPGGENVYPAEVEQTILAHPAIAEVAVVGVSDAQWGEAVKAVCVLKAGHALTAETLIEFVGKRIARYKRPKHVVFVQALPRTSAGALDRAALVACI